MPARTLAVVTAIALLTAAAHADLNIGLNDPNEVVSVSDELTVEGDLNIYNDGRLEVLDGATMIVTGDINLFNNANLTLDGGNLVFPQDFAYQSNIRAINDATFAFTNATIDTEFSFGLNLNNNANATWTNVDLASGFSTWAFGEMGSATLTGCPIAGEFVLFGEGSVNVTDCGTVLLWMTLPDGATVDLTLPPPGNVASYMFDDTQPGVTGVPYAFSINDCTDVMWALMARPGSNATFRDSTLRVVGSFFDRDNAFTIEGVASNQFLSDQTNTWGDVTHRFINSTVQTWNFYALGTTNLTLRQCVAGEIWSSADAEVFVDRCVCDGTGGYINAEGNSRMVLSLSTNTSQTTVRDQAQLVVAQSSLLNPNIDVTGSGAMISVNSVQYGDTDALDAGAFIDLSIEPTKGVVGDMIDLYGTARVLTGPDNPVEFISYEIEYEAENAPDVWNPISSSTEPVRTSTLGVWDTTGVEPGDHTVRLLLNFTFLAEPVQTVATVQLRADQCPGDLNGDGEANGIDVGIFLSQYASNSPAADINGDGSINGLDVGAFLALYAAGC